MTSVEWLISKQKHNQLFDIETIEKAKEMEKKQRISDIHFGHGISSNVNINYEAYFKLQGNKNKII